MSGTVKIKQLEWQGDFAHTPFGLFYHIKPEEDGYILSQHEGSSTTHGFYGSRRDAQSSAQANYDARVLSAIEAAS